MVTIETHERNGSQSFIPPGTHYQQSETSSFTVCDELGILACGKITVPWLVVEKLTKYKPRMLTNMIAQHHTLLFCGDW